MDLENELLDIFGGHGVLMANGQRELLVGLEVLEPVGVDLGESARFGIEIVLSLSKISQMVPCV